MRIYGIICQNGNNQWTKNGIVIGLVLDVMKINTKEKTIDLLLGDDQHDYWFTTIPERLTPGLQEGASVNYHELLQQIDQSTPYSVRRF
jgi:hypothetical protein